MITIVIPTYNRAYALIRVLNSYYGQKFVSEIIIVDDAGTDNTKEEVNKFISKYPNILTNYIKNSIRQGAASCRITGYENAVNDYILFGEDDVYLAPNYCAVLYEKLTQDETMGLASGRIIYLEYQECILYADVRFQNGITNEPPFNYIDFGCNVNAKFTGDIQIPVTHAIFLTKKSHLEKFGIDNSYYKGNGYREETDYQIKVFLHGYKNIITSDTKCYHIHRQETQSGGQRLNRCARLYWSIYYTKYFYDKHFDRIGDKLSIKYSKTTALLLFSVLQTYRLFIRPLIRFPRFLLRKYLT